MGWLFIESNFFQGSFIATNLSEALKQLKALGNQFSEIAVVDSKTEAHIDISESGVTSVVDENGNERAKNWRVAF